MSGVVLLTGANGAALVKFPMMKRPTPGLDLAKWGWGKTKAALSWAGKKVGMKSADDKDSFAVETGGTFGYSGGPEDPSLTQGLDWDLTG